MTNPPSVRRNYTCSICGGTGHNRSTCEFAPLHNLEIRTNWYDNNDTTNISQNTPPHTPPQTPPNNTNTPRTIVEENINIEEPLKIINNTDYDIYLYIINNSILNCIGNIEKYKEEQYEPIVGVEILFFKKYVNSSNLMSNINLDDIICIKWIDQDDYNIIIDDRKTELNTWKSCALKSKFLIDQISKLGGNNINDTLKTLIDLFQDIIYPNITEEDKEDAGVPSLLTNIT